MKTILVPTDFSDAANNAALYAAHLAQEMNAELCLFHAYHIPIPASDIPVPYYSPADLQKENEELLEKNAEYLRNKLNIKIQCKAKIGLAVDELLDEEGNYDVVVMGMQGAGKLSEWLIGSVTTAYISKTKKPVFAIPEDASFKKPETVIFACDYKSSTNSLDTLKDILKTFQSKLYIVNVINSSDVVSVDEAMVGIKLENKFKEIEHIFSFPESDDLVEGINEFAEEHEADLIALVPHKHNFIERIFRESITKKMAFHTHVPLLALPDNHKTVPVYAL